MEDSYYAALSRLINDHVRLGPSRRETIIELLAAIPKAGTVNLNRLAPHIESKAKTASVYRRLERFFSEVRLNDAEVAHATVAMLGLRGKPWHLAMDRTNWKLGKTDLNVLVLSVAVNQVCAPLFWTVLDNDRGLYLQCAGSTIQNARREINYLLAIGQIRAHRN